MPFTEEQQKEYRAEFIRECRQKAWGAACHAEWIAKQLDEMAAEHNKLRGDDAALLAEITGLATALDSHSKDNRDKRKELQARRTGLTEAMQMIAKNMAQGQQALQQLYASVESSLALAAHAEGW